jgi:hypothetical protein
MNKVILLALLMPVTAFGQIMENFESGNLSGWVQSPEGHWNTDYVNAVSGTGSLHHSFDNPEAGMDWIGTALRNLHPDKGNAIWNFTVRHGYEPSASNNWALFIMSDSDPASARNGPGINGYAVGVNQTGYDDTLRLWKVKNGLFSTVVNSHLNWQTGIGITDAAKIRVERSPTGEWHMEVRRINNDLIISSTGNDSELFAIGWFLVSYKYTSTRDRLLWLDDIVIDGTFYEDGEPPEVSECKVAGSNLLLISFNEEVSEESLSLSNFSLNQIDNLALRVTKRNSLSVYIEFREQFINKSANKLVLNNLCDRLSNCKSNIEIEFTPVWADPGDVIITEIMADPVPAVDLPAKEYIELYNRTQYSFNLKNWSLSDGSTSCVIPEKVILPGGRLILCQTQDSSLFNMYGKTMGLKSFPVLTDAGKIIYICDSTESLIHGVEYSSVWYGNVLKADGGWSLEIIDTDYPFFGYGNWQASESVEGGTPGRINSVSGVNRDNIFSGIENVFPDDSSKIRIKFSETIIGLNKRIESIEIQGSKIDTLFNSDPLLRDYTAFISQPLRNGRVYTLTVGDDVTDFAGNKMDKKEFGFGLPEPVNAGDILFNELLFNPFPEEPDFIEFYNCSDRIIDASDLLLVSVNDELHDTSSVVLVSTENHCILPRNYNVITSDKEALLKRFSASDPDNIFEVSFLPSMPDDKGHLILYDRNLKKIDEVFYDEKMHYSLLGGYEGISLEKVRINSISADKTQWHSASESSGWGTPGAPNSVLIEHLESSDKISLSSTKITPDNDGNEDFLVIDFKLAGIGNVISIEVFDETGRFVKKLSDNLLAGPEASIVWNGTAEDEKLVSTGIYILLITVFDEKGKSEKLKKVCTVIRK